MVVVMKDLSVGLWRTSGSAIVRVSGEGNTVEGCVSVIGDAAMVPERGRQDENIVEDFASLTA